MLLVTDHNNRGDEWILDLGYTFHINPKRSNFDTFEDFDGGRLLMGNNTNCKVEEIGTIKLKLHERLCGL